jgi:hypothetical protein
MTGPDRKKQHQPDRVDRNWHAHDEAGGGEFCRSRRSERSAVRAEH